MHALGAIWESRSEGGEPAPCALQEPTSVRRLACADYRMRSLAGC
jgi:hypothetical protein